MAKNRITDLRDHLFETLERLKDEESPIDVERARAICQVSQQIIESAKVEVEAMRVVNADRPSKFFDGVEPESRDLPARLLNGSPKQ